MKTEASYTISYISVFRHFSADNRRKLTKKEFIFEWKFISVDRWKQS